MMGCYCDIAMAGRETAVRRSVRRSSTVWDLHAMQHVRRPAHHLLHTNSALLVVESK
jgi:hypothetical protein